MQRFTQNSRARELAAGLKKEGSDEDASFRRDSGVGDSFVGSMSSLNQDSENVFSQDSPKVIQRVVGDGNRTQYPSENRRNRTNLISVHITDCITPERKVKLPMRSSGRESVDKKPGEKDPKFSLWKSTEENTLKFPANLLVTSTAIKPLGVFNRRRSNQRAIQAAELKRVTQTLL